MDKWHLIIETENFRAFGCEHSIAYHYRNENGRWRKGTFDEPVKLSQFLVEILKQIYIEKGFNDDSANR